jgi:hypothetical protein
MAQWDREHDAQRLHDWARILKKRRPLSTGDRKVLVPALEEISGELRKDVAALERFFPPYDVWMMD